MEGNPRMNDEDFLAAFETCTLDPRLWTHRAHVRVAYMYASQHSLRDSTDKMRASIQAYAKARSVPDTIDRGYHETVTAAFMQLVYAARIQSGPHESPAKFCATHPELLDSRALEKYYSKERLKCWQAKTSFMDPDLCPLPIVIHDSITIAHANDGENLELIRQLFTEYAKSLNFEPCFEGFEHELAGLPGHYGLPAGRLLLAHSNGLAAGCVALRPCSDGKCEMKRLWVRPEFRGTGVGKSLVDTVTGNARAIGYATLRLNTAVSMRAAIGLYQSQGFITTKSESEEPEPGVLYMERKLC